MDIKKTLKIFVVLSFLFVAISTLALRYDVANDEEKEWAAEEHAKEVKNYTDVIMWGTLVFMFSVGGLLVYREPEEKGEVDDSKHPG